VVTDQCQWSQSLFNQQESTICRYIVLLIYEKLMQSKVSFILVQKLFNIFTISHFEVKTIMPTICMPKSKNVVKPFFQKENN